MNRPEQVQTAPQNTASASVEQHIIAIDTAQKRNLLERLIVDLHINQVIVFCKTKQSVDQVARDLKRRGLSVAPIHGDKSQQTRLETLNAFKAGELRVLVATDVAARGLDIAELPFVINYEMPTQAEDYVHRIGRTGRAGAEGVAISLMDEDEQKMFEAIKELIGKELPVERIEGFEPRWWPQQQEGGRPAAEHAPRDTREPREARNGRRGRNADSRSKSSARGSYADNSPEQECWRIPGRRHRSRRHRPVCALVQPNYGIDG